MVELQTSSYIPSPYFFGGALVLSCLCAYYGFIWASGFLFFLFLLSMTAYIWGRFCAHGIGADIQSTTRQVYPGQSITMDFTLENNKLLPLLWLEWVQPSPPNGCLEVPPEFQICDVTPLGSDPMPPVLCRRFSFIKWYATLHWSSTFQAVARGVYIPHTVDIQTGDGFGLSGRKLQYPLTSPPVFVVYPKRVAVTTAVFFKNAWSASTGPQGILEDVTVLRGIRTYQQSDSFKRINWRLAARNDTLNVNLYETIAPRTVYFLIDTASFHGRSPGNEAFEQTLSVIGSLTSELFDLGMTVGLYFPGEDTTAAPHTEDVTAPDCLLQLALAQCKKPTAQFSPQSLAQLISAQSGHIYYVCYDGGQGGFAKPFEQAGIANFSLISYLEPALTPDSAINLSTIPVHLISSFCKEGGL